MKNKEKTKVKTAGKVKEKERGGGSAVATKEKGKRVYRWEDYFKVSRFLFTNKGESDFFKALERNEGRWPQTCKELGLSTWDYWKKQQDEPQFAEEVKKIRARHEDNFYHRLERISEEQAEIPSKTTERIFHLNALNSAKYRPKTSGFTAQNVQINTTSLNIGDRIDIVNQLRGKKKKSEPKGRTAVNQTITEDAVSVDDVKI